MNRFLLLLVFSLSLGHVVNAQITVVSITDAAEEEGGVLLHDITLSETTTEEIALTFSFRLISASFGSENSDIDLVGWLGGGVNFGTNPDLLLGRVTTIFVPAGIRTFTLRVDTVQDDIEENDEQYQFTVDDITATGTILDNNDAGTTTIFSLADATETEGRILEHEVVLSNLVAKEVTFPLSQFDITTDNSDYGALFFSDGISFNAGTGLVIIPESTAGIERFTITISTIDDFLIEDDESYSLTVGGIAATGTILDNDTITIRSVSDASEAEGQNLVHTIQLSNQNPIVQTFTLAIINNTTVTSDYDAPLFSNGVSLNSVSGEITLPIGISSFTVTFMAVDDVFDEDEETYTLQIDDLEATGTILDNDTYEFPKFFTPNNDTVHDTWPHDMQENSYIYEDAVIHIFDRYGKLLLQFTATSNGWDGRYNNILMPSADYWYQIIWQDGAVRRGHFTLKR